MTTSPFFETLRHCFESAAGPIREALTAYVSRHYGHAIPGEELVQQSLTDLWEYQCSLGPEGLDPEDLPTVLARRAMVILKRRIADYFRGPDRRTETVAAFDDEAQEDPLSQRLLLARIAQWVDEQDRLDQILILSGLQPGAPLTSTERTRLSRLRDRMRQDLGLDAQEHQ